MRMVVCGILALMTALNMYLLPGKVLESTGEKVVVESHDGNVWEYYGDAQVGAEIIMVMDDNGTYDITDDRIMEVY